MTATYWWQPGRPEKALPGVLVQDDEHGWLLHLDGSFEEADLAGLTKGDQPVRLSHKRPNDFPVLVGTNSQGHLISLIDCQVLEWSYSIPSLSRGALKIWPTILAHGVHFERAEDFRLMSLSVRYTHLDTWAGANGFTVKLGTAFYPVEVRYAKPDPVECTIRTG